MAVKFKAKAFRLTNRLTYIIGVASAETGIPEAHILDECLTRRIIGCASRAAKSDAAKKAEKVSKKIKSMLSTLHETGKFEPRPKRMRPEVVDAIVGASALNNIPQTEIVEQSLEMGVADVVRDIVNRKSIITHSSTKKRLAEDAVARGSVPNDTRRTTWSSSRFDAIGALAVSALKQVKPRLSRVASGQEEVPGIGRVKNSSG